MVRLLIFGGISSKKGIETGGWNISYAALESTCLLRRQSQNLYVTLHARQARVEDN
jgi:hypothetical protein